MSRAVMGLFLDGSALVRAYVEQPGTTAVGSLLGDPHRSGALFTAAHAQSEVISALAERVRGRFLSRRALSRALTEFARDYPASFHVVQITPDLLTDVGRLISSRTSGRLGPLQAMHLAAAQHVRTVLMYSRLTVVSCDRGLLTPAREKGFAVFNPETDAATGLPPPPAARA